MKHIITMSAFLSLALAASAQTNTFVGSGAGAKNKTGESNTAVGANAMPNNKTGGFNVAVGDGSLLKNSKGNNNIAIGVDAGAKLTKDDNICIDNVGRAKDSGTIRLGRPGTHKKSYFAGKMFGDGSGLKKVKVKPTNIKGTIPGSKITASSINGSHLADSLALPGTTTGAFSGSFSGDLDGNAATATTATSLSGSLNGSQIANGTVTSSKLASNLTLAGTTSGTFSGNLSGNAATATSAASLSGSLNGSQLVDDSITSDKLAPNLTLAGATTGNFSGSFLGNLAGSALLAQTVFNEKMRIAIDTTGEYGDADNYIFDSGNQGMLLETTAGEESAGLFLNGNTAIIYSPGDSDIFQVHDEDNMGTAVFRVLNGDGGTVTEGPGAFQKGIASCGVEELRTLRGSIASDGSTLSGSGFTSSRTGTGAYTITFTDIFGTSDITPVVTCKGNVLRIPTIVSTSTTSFTIRIWNSSDALVDCDFYFNVTAP